MIAPENFSWVLSHIKCDFIDGSSDCNDRFAPDIATAYFSRSLCRGSASHRRNTASAMTAASMLKIAAITKTAAQLPVQVVNTLLASAELIQHQHTAAF